MKKITLIIGFIYLFCPAFAYETGFGFDSFKSMKNSIHNRLDLTFNQQEKKQQIDMKFYPELQIKFDEISKHVADVEMLANSENCSKEQVDKIKHEFRISEKDLDMINKEYEKEFNAILTKEQKNKYIALKKEQKKILKKQIETEIKLQKEDIKNQIPEIEY